MWLKIIDEITRYIPDDGLIHDIQIIGDFIYVDGNCQNPYVEIFEGKITNGKVYKYAMTDEEILEKYNKSLEPTNTTDPKTKTE